MEAIQGGRHIHRAASPVEGAQRHAEDIVTTPLQNTEARAVADWVPRLKQQDVIHMYVYPESTSEETANGKTSI